MNDLYEKMLTLSGGDLPPERGPGKPGEQARSRVDPSKARKLLGWKPEVGLEAGLEKTLRFFGAV